MLKTKGIIGRGGGMNPRLPAPKRVSPCPQITRLPMDYNQLHGVGMPAFAQLQKSFEVNDLGF